MRASTEGTQELPTFAGIADMRCQEARLGTKTVNLKLAINTARMMVEAERKREKFYPMLLQMVRDLADKPEGGSARALLRAMGEGE